jgi:hypothetical protein
MVSYWPQAGIALGLVLNIGGAVTNDSLLFAFGTNVLVLSSGFALQRRQNDRRSGED